MKFIITFGDDLQGAVMVDGAELLSRVKHYAARRDTSFRDMRIWRAMNVRVTERRLYTLRGIDDHSPADLVGVLGLIQDIEAGKLCHKHGKAFQAAIKKKDLTTVQVEGRHYFYRDEIDDWLAARETR